MTEPAAQSVASPAPPTSPRESARAGMPERIARVMHPDAAFRRSRLAVSAFFLLLGIGVATWAALVPFAKAKLGLDEGTLGAILLAFGAGTIVATLGASALVRRLGSHRLLTIGGAGMALFLPLLALASSAPLLALFLFGFGACTGFTGVAANAQAVAVQASSGHAVMSSFHALFSIGGLAGAGLSSLALRLGMPITWWTVLVTAALLLLAAAQHHGLVVDRDAHEPRTGRASLPPVPVLIVGLMTLALYLAEGAVLDWGAVFLHEYRGYAVATAALGYAAFSVAMATGRLLGDRIVDRLGPVTVVRFGSILAAVGFLVLVFAPSAAAGLLGCALIGLGASNVVPTLISASVRVSDMPTASAVSTVAAMGTCGLIAGPAVIGFVAQGTNLRVALAGLAALLAAVAWTSRIVRVR